MSTGSEKLETVDTNSADDSKGIAFGLSGNLFLPVVLSGLLSILILTQLVWAKTFSMPVAFLLSAIPFAVTLATVLYFFQGKRPHYASDLFQTWAGNNCFSRHPYNQKEHPRKRADKALSKQS